jgi:hypothetical protein
MEGPEARAMIPIRKGHFPSIVTAALTAGSWQAAGRSDFFFKKKVTPRLDLGRWKWSCTIIVESKGATLNG